MTASLFGEKKTRVFSMKRPHLPISASVRLEEDAMSMISNLRTSMLNFLINRV